NGFGGTVAVTSSIYLKGTPTNERPTMATIEDVVVDEGSPLSLQVHASDVNATQTLAYSLDISAAFGISIHPLTGLIIGNWNDQLAGPLTVVVTAMDNGTPPLPARDTFRITVRNVAPTASISGATTGLPGQLQSFTLLASDPSSVDQAAGFTFRIDW